MKDEVRRKRKVRAGMILSVAFLMMASIRYISGFASVSSNVNGRELPIYSVETKEKKVALSFDAAWGNGYSW